MQHTLLITQPAQCCSMHVRLIAYLGVAHCSVGADPRNLFFRSCRMLSFARNSCPRFSAGFAGLAGTASRRHSHAALTPRLSNLRFKTAPACTVSSTSGAGLPRWLCLIARIFSCKSSDSVAPPVHNRSCAAAWVAIMPTTAPGCKKRRLC